MIQGSSASWNGHYNVLLATYQGVIYNKATRCISPNCDALAHALGLNGVGYPQTVEPVNGCDIAVFIMILINAAQIEIPDVLIFIICTSWTHVEVSVEDT